MAHAPDEVIEWLRKRNNFLVLTHERPDGDAFGCLYAMVLMLEKLGKNCVAHLPTPLPARYTAFLPACTSVEHMNAEPAVPVENVICLDTTDSERIAAPDDLHPARTALPLCNIDHHPDNAQYGECVWTAPDTAATAEMLAMLGHDLGALTPAAATCCIAGIITDTGGFQYANTTAETFRITAGLKDRGGDYEGAVDALFFRKHYNRLCLEAYLINNARFVHHRRLVYAILRPELLDDFGVEKADTEGLIDTLRTIDGVNIACLLQPENQAVRFSLRARSKRTEVKDIARTLGGGGHPLAAGARVPDITVEDAETKLIELTRKPLLSL